MKIKDWLALAGFIALSEGAGIIGSVFTAPSIADPLAGSGQGWYATLVRPEFAPPNWIFGPVWTTLFLLMGVAAFLVWRQHPHILKDVRMLSVWKWAVFFFFVQLALNVFWSFVFFGLHNPGGAFVEIIFLWLAIFATIIAFYRISKPAAWLLVPYILWVSFAAYLNYAIWILN